MRTNTIAFCLLLAATACSSIQEEPVNTERAKSAADEVFYATLEQSGAAGATKVYADENLKVLWNADDRISIYNRYTYGYQYAFQGITGDSAGAFLKKEDDAEFITGNPLEHIYAVYPYREDNKINNSGDLSITWPSTQTYKADSFGIGANVMVSVTDNNQLRFRNVGGYLELKLYGDNVSVSSITLRGNNGEKLSGRATVTASTDADPTLSFQSTSSESIRLECPAPVSIGSTAETATTFWMVVPPTEFTQGFNITVRTSNGLVFVKSTDIAYEIERNTLHRMAAVEVIPSDIVPFADANFKAYCVTNFDADNDGEISISEASSVTAIRCWTWEISSLEGIEYFTNIEELKFDYNKVTSADLSHNNALRILHCQYNQLVTLDVSNNSMLTNLNCHYNQLTSLNVSNNSALTNLDCSYNQLTTLDVSNNTTLTGLYCSYNQLTSLDVSNNTALEYLQCYNNHLTALDISNNTALTNLSCENNQLTTLDVTNNASLISLGCSDNQLTSLDVTNNPLLTHLGCDSNQLTALDVSNNTSLTNLSCRNNQLTSLDVSNNTALIKLACSSNKLTNLDVAGQSSLKALFCKNNPSLSVVWSDYNNDIRNLQFDSNVTTIKYKGVIPFLDSNFKDYCVANFDTNGDGEIDYKESMSITSISCQNLSISSLKGIEHFANLASLDCSGNQLSQLDVQNNLEINFIDCSGNQLWTLDVSNNSALISLDCTNNQQLSEIWLAPEQTLESFSYDTSTASLHRHQVIWENDGTFGSTGWRMDYLFYSSDNSPENELFTLPQNTWEKMLSGPFYLLASIDDSNYYMQIMSGWWTSQWPDSSGLKAGDNHITDNGDGTITVEINFIGAPIVNELDIQGLLFTGDGYTPLKLFFQ